MTHNWTYKKLGEVGQVITGSTPTTKDERNYSSKDVCFFKPSDFSSEKLTELASSEFYISSYAYEHSRKLPKDSVLTTCIGIIGKVGILTADATCNQQINTIIPNKEIIVPRFLGYSIISIKNLLSERANAPVVPLLNKSQFSSIEIPIPSLSEQESIVAELDAINHLIDLQEQQLREYDRLAQSLFYTTFGDPTTNPKGWEIKNWSDVLEIINGKNQSAVANPNGKYLLCGSGGEMGRADDYLCEENSVIIGRKGNINRPLLMREKYWNVDTAFGLQPKKDVLLVDYLYQFCVAFDFENLNVAVTIPSLRKVDLLKIQIPVPPLALQQTFAAQIETIEQQKALIRRSLDETRTLLAARMQYYFE